jgi:type III secretory pathway component EscS
MTTKIIFGTLAYIIPTFILAYFWHLKWFKKLYEIWDYAGGNPSPPLGLASMIVQGIVLSVLYAWGPIDRTSILDAIKFIGILAVLHWSVHVLSAMAKNPKIRNWHYFGFETFYLVLQFGLFAILISSVVY